MAKDERYAIRGVGRRGDRNAIIDKPDRIGRPRDHWALFRWNDNPDPTYPLRKVGWEKVKNAPTFKTKKAGESWLGGFAKKQGESDFTAKGSKMARALTESKKAQRAAKAVKPPKISKQALQIPMTKQEATERWNEARRKQTVAGGGKGTTSDRSTAAKKAWETRRRQKTDTGWRTIKGKKVKVKGKKKR